MSLTVATIETSLNTYIGDTSTDRISAAERLNAVTEATAWLLEELGNDHSIKTYSLNFLDTVNYYKVTTPVSDLLASADLRREIEDQTISALHKASRDLAEDIGQGSNQFAWTVERRDADTYLGITLDLTDSTKRAKIIADFDATNSGGGTWAVDATNSDATNLTVDTNEKKQGSASLNFDVDVSQSANNKATIQNSTLSELDLSDYEDLGSWVFEVYIPDVTYFSSITMYWGSSTSAYWSATVTTDINGTAFANEWNKVKINWADATATGVPDETAIDYIGFDFNYTASQTDDTDFRIDYLRIANPEKLTFHYVSWDVGTDSGGTDISAFSATTDIPFFSGKYDQYKYVVAHKAAATIFYSLRLREEAQFEEREARNTLERQRKIFPTSKIAETHNFRPYGISFRPRRRSSRWAG